MKNIKMQRAQASIEATLSLICLALLLMGGLRIFLWSARHAVERQQKYEDDRAGVTATTATAVLLPRDLPKLDIFAESGIKQ